MATAKLFKHGGSQAVRLPKEFRFEGSEVLIERRGDEVILKAAPVPKFKTAAELAHYLKERFPDSGDFPEPPPRSPEPPRSIPEF